MDTKADQASLDPALAVIKQLLERKHELTREIEICEADLREAWRKVPRVETSTTHKHLLDAARNKRLLQAANNNQTVAKILGELFYGD